MKRLWLADFVAVIDQSLIEKGICEDKLRIGRASEAFLHKLVKCRCLKERLEISIQSWMEKKKTNNQQLDGEEARDLFNTLTFFFK